MLIELSSIDAGDGNSAETQKVLLELLFQHFTMLWTGRPPSSDLDVTAIANFSSVPRIHPIELYFRKA
jgi:hypothetical protein